MKRAVILLWIVCLMPLSSWAACKLPAPPKQFPDGEAASRDEMQQLRQQLERYVDEQGRYLKCLDAMEKTAKGTGYDTVQRRLERIARYNTAMAEMSAAVERYNREAERFNLR